MCSASNVQPSSYYYGSNGVMVVWYGNIHCAKCSANEDAPYLKHVLVKMSREIHFEIRAQWVRKLSNEYALEKSDLRDILSSIYFAFYGDLFLILWLIWDFYSRNFTFRVPFLLYPGILTTRKVVVAGSQNLIHI